LRDNIIDPIMSGLIREFRHARMAAMLEEILGKISEEASGDRALETVASVSRFHRIQASPGFRRAAGYCLDAMLEASDDALVIHYPAEDGVKFWHFPSFEEWQGKRGTLRITAPDHLAGKVADFEACPISLIQRSARTPREGLETEIVYAGRGEDPADYKGARGKIAIVDAYAPHSVYDAASKAGVLGIIIYRQRPLDPVRTGPGVEGIRPYCSFWWDEKDLFGFVLTPEEGERLVSYLRSSGAKKFPIRATAHVEGERYPGTMEVVTSLIPGDDRKEIVLLAHLCHPQPSAGDNASGVAVVLEVHRFLNHLIGKGILPRPRYGIRFLLVPELSGTFAFLAREKAVARNLMIGLNLDMVGQKQDVTGSTLCIEKPPLASPSFGPYVLSELARGLLSVASNPGSTASLPLIKWTVTPFSGGSDHAVLSDPMVGVSTPMMIQWPDKYYHTSGDKPENISADLIGKIAVIAGTYVYSCALSEESTLMQFASSTGRGLRKEAIDALAALRGSPAGEWITPRYKARVLAVAGSRALRSIGRLAPESRRLRGLIDSEKAATMRCIQSEAAVAAKSRGAVNGEAESSWAARRGELKDLEKIVVKRLSPGPVDPRGLMRQLTPSKRARFMKRIVRPKDAAMMSALGLYWADGRRSMAEIVRLVAAELGDTDPEVLKTYFGLLRRAGLIEFKRK
jgi:aminopeptidase YwaD